MAPNKRKPAVHCVVLCLAGLSALSFFLNQAAALSAQAALGPLQTCQQEKLLAALKHTRSFGRCFRTFARPRRSATERFAACTENATATLEERFASVNAAALASKTLCPANTASLLLSGSGAWLEALLSSGVFAGNTLPSRCVARATATVTHLAVQRATCAARDFLNSNPQRLSRCVSRKDKRFAKRWSRPLGGSACSSLSATNVIKQVDSVLELQTSLLEVSCGDFIRAGSEECDDGNGTDGDGCTAGCLAEECIDVGGTVNCIRCPANSLPNADHTACDCASGFALGGNGCVDIDECAAGAASCPAGRPCVNVPGSYACAIPCTQAAFEAALADCGTPTGVIAFNCTNTTIRLAEAAGDNNRRITCDGLLIDGLNRNIVFELDPPCFDVAGSVCPNVDNGTGFLVFEGDHNTVRNLTVRYFFDGIHTSGTDNTIESVDLVRQCDDSLTNDPTGVGNIFRNLDVRDGCDKCTQHFGDITLTSPDPQAREHYSAIFDDVRLLGCQKPFRMTNGGRFLIRHNQMLDPPGSRFSCIGPLFTSGPSDDLVVHLVDSVVNGCNRGVRFGGDAQGILQDNIIENSSNFGVRAFSSAMVSLAGNYLFGNGGSQSSSEPGVGGVVVADDADIDLGGGLLLIDGSSLSSPGENVLCRNRATKRGPQEIDAENLNDPTKIIRAQHNWWCARDPAGRVVGNVDVSLPLASTP